ncbi:hypothetical protein GGX14DRAFT_402665 [Mycena pura]|uniref:Uncharacterized protein n=1 Tax=Mycena pura TaxID=153505 RepID=A0AAD6V050_9AGAR|nr:hypothetical protein GGX14DRAFT_402665 [Mycena pura]
MEWAIRVALLTPDAAVLCSPQKGGWILVDHGPRCASAAANACGAHGHRGGCDPAQSTPDHDTTAVTAATGPRPHLSTERSGSAGRGTAVVECLYGIDTVPVPWWTILAGSHGMGGAGTLCKSERSIVLECAVTYPESKTDMSYKDLHVL